MKISRSYIIAFTASLALAAWFIWHNTAGAPDENDTASVKTAETEASLPTVVILNRTAQSRRQVLELFGQSEANRQVSVKANTSSVVIQTPLTEGNVVQAGQIMCAQHVNERDAVIAQTRAQAARAELEYNASVKLAERGFRSATQVATFKAGLDAARAGLKAAEVERNNVNMIVPFRGIFERQEAQVGDFLAPGQACGLVVELDPLIIAIQLTEQQVGQVKVGQTTEIKLATGETVTGTLRRIEAIANPSTRSFRTEITVPNKNMTLKAGVTAEVRLQSEAVVAAQNIPAGILALNDAGDIGVRFLDYEDRVRFARTTTIDEDSSGIWVTGLPDQTRVIIKGQDYVSDGTLVAPSISSGSGQ